MAIQVVPHDEKLRRAAEEFNERMHQAGSPWGVYVDPESDWLATRHGSAVWREHYLAVDESGAVRGGFVLKPQEWLIRGESHVVTDWQGPVSEGSVDPRYTTLGIRLMREMVKRYPAVFSWGHGGSDQPVVQMLNMMKWPMHETPFCLLILKPFRFARRNAYLRRKRIHRLALDLMAFSGVGYVGIRLMHALRRLQAWKRFVATAQTFERFEQWADDLWNENKGKYSAIAVRDSVSMNCLAPESGWPPVMRLKVERNGETIGWALVMNTQMRSDARFGDLHVGSLVDCFADPADAGDVVWASTRFLQANGVDIVVSNQAHPAWVRGFAENGYLVLPNRRLFVTSPALRQFLEPFDETAQGLHLTNMDGHGPHAL